MIKIICPILNISEAEAFLSIIKEDGKRFIVVFKHNDNKEIGKYITAIGAHLIRQGGNGIYNAINLAIDHLDQNDFYIVMGSDDVVFMPALKECEDMNLDQNCVYTAKIEIEGSVVRSKRSYLLHGHKALVSEHAVGSLLSKHLHNRYGLYSENNIIASDAKFLMHLRRNEVNFDNIDVCLGEYGGNGISTRRYFKGQMELISSIYAVHAWHMSSIMIALVILRIMKNAIVWQFRSFWR